MENLSLILSTAVTAAGLLVSTLTFLLKFIKSSKARKLAENVIAIGNAVIPYIEQAELFTNYSGTEKKEYVLTKANQFAINHGIKFDKNLISEKIEELVNLSKEVNSRDKDKANKTQSIQAIKFQASGQ